MSEKSEKRVRRNYSDVYRRNAVSLVEDQGYTTAQAARELGVNANLLHKWRHKYSKSANADSEVSQSDEDDLNRLRGENHRLRMERDLLKKRRPSSQTQRTELFGSSKSIAKNDQLL